MIIGTRLIPAHRKNERAKLTVYECSLDGNCPLFTEAGACQNQTILLQELCPYGRVEIKQSHTKASGAYSREFREFEEFRNANRFDIECVPTTAHLCQIGDYIYWPYRYLQYRDNKPTFVVNILVSDKSFLKKEDFTLDFICAAAKFRPYALMGGEITRYREEVVPRMLLHLSVIFPDMFDQLPQAIKSLTLKLTKDTSVTYTLSQVPAGRVRLNNSWGYWDGKNTFIVTGCFDNLRMTFWHNQSLNGSEVRAEFVIPSPDKVRVSELDEELQSKLSPDAASMIKALTL